MGFVFLMIALLLGISIGFIKSYKIKMFMALLPIVSILVYYIFLSQEYQNIIDSYFISLNFIKGV